MSLRKGRKNANRRDFTLNDSANAPKPVTRIKKSVVDEVTSDLSWDQIEVNQYDVTEEIGADGTKSFVLKRKQNCVAKQNNDQYHTGNEYPEIVWYLISKYVDPEDVSRFAGINRSTYTITKQKSFWHMLYKRFCKNNPKLPEKLHIENSYKYYGLQQRVIRALYHTYDVFINRVVQQAAQDSKPHDLVKRRCVNVWYHKGPSYWLVYFKLKKLNLAHRVQAVKTDFLEELEKIDANPDEGCQVLQVACQNFYDVPPLLGMTLSSVKVLLQQGFSHHRLLLGFSSSHYNISKDIIPECSVVMDSVIKILVLDWWHPNYPHFDNKLPSYLQETQTQPVLKNDFFTYDEDT